MEIINADDFAKHHIRPPKKKRNKYNVAPKEQRTIGTRTYDSKAEAVYANRLWALVKEGSIIDVVPQPSVQLGEDSAYRPDFLVIPWEMRPYYVDVKGVRTSDFKRNVRLWKKYGRLDLHVVERDGDGFATTEVIGGAS